MNVLIDPIYRWKVRSMNGGLQIHFIGHASTVETVANKFITPALLSIGELGNVICDQVGHFAAILDRGDAVLAFVDHCRSYPLFYHTGQTTAVSNSARELRAASSSNTVNEAGALDFAMAGYVTGGNTVFENLRQLQAGELLLWDRKKNKLTLHRYYRYFPHKLRTDSLEEITESLHVVIDRVMQRTAENAGGRPVWVPLSGGLDSRLILSSLKKLSYDHLHAFSYGPPSNHEAKIAKQVANHLEIPWTFIPTHMGEARRFFKSETRHQFWKFSDGLSTIPNAQDLLPLYALRESGQLPEDAVIVNGQSGDFITGGHIPSQLTSERPNIQALIQTLIDKHYSLWRHLKTPANLDKIEAEVRESLNLENNSGLSADELSANYEFWEWQERQSKYVVHGQRVYDFLGLNWELPFWDSELMKFWQHVPIIFKRDQTLYRHFLHHYDYRQVFNSISDNVWRWPGLTIAIVPFARAAGIILGEEYKHRIYNYAKYVGHYRNHYATIDLRRFIKHSQDARNALAFYVADWLSDNAGIENLSQ